MTRKMVDIVIPIYNAYEDLQICLESFYKYTDLANNRLILINDNSPDSRIREILDKQNKENVIVIHNETNKGFSNNINIGMAQSEYNDVILLNSDTILTERWVEKLVECAYSDESIGTVTPVSNNATLCSVPEFCKENVLPDGITVDQAGKIVEKCSLKRYPRITVAHGFCMYVKREVINVIGNFDAETFERGYGEENDFCNRAEQAGYHHVMCDNTYIYHSGTKSFVSKEKEEYIRKHDRILRDRYPEQMHNNDVHVRDNPNFFIGENIGIYFDLCNGKKNILYVVQSDFRKNASDNKGGTQLHVRDLVSGMRNTYNVFVAARDEEYINLTVYYGKKERLFRYYIGLKNNIYEFKNKKFDQLWRNILSAFEIELIHVHHVIGMSFDIFYVAKEYNIPIVFTAHDFYFICPSIKLLDEQDTVCVGKDNAEYCRSCLKQVAGITNKLDYITLWREKCADILKYCKLICTPNKSAKEVLDLYYPQFADKIKVVEHGYNLDREQQKEVQACSYDVKCCFEQIEKEGGSYKIEGWAYLDNIDNGLAKTYLMIENSSGKKVNIPTTKLYRPDVRSGNSDVGFSGVVPLAVLDGGKLTIRVVMEYDDHLYYAMEQFETPELKVVLKNALNIAFIGGLNKAKGGEEIYRIIKKMHQDVNWYVFGGIGVSELAELNQENLIKTGYYEGEDLQILLATHEIDVIGILSIWPETYSYTLTEAILNKIPVIVTDIGALGGRTRENGYGWLVNIDNIEQEFIEITKSIIEDKRELIRYQERLSSVCVPDIIDMAEAYKNIYAKYLEGENIKEYETADYQMIYAGYMKNGTLLSHAINENGTYEYINEQMYNQVKHELDIIQSSVTYKIARKIADANFPGKNILRKCIMAHKH